MSDISNVLRKVIELDISLGLDGTQEALDEITRRTAEVEKLNSELTDALTDLATARQDNASFGPELKRLTSEVERLTVEAQISYAEGFHDGDENGSKIKREFLEKLEAENEKLKRHVAENERLRAALEKLIRACHEGRIVQRSAGGMTIEAQTKNSVINGVSAWAVCEAEEVLDSAALSPTTQEKP